MDLSGAHLGAASLLTGANLTTARFLMQQLDSARGDKDTKLPAGQQRPAHWSAGPAAADQ